MVTLDDLKELVENYLEQISKGKNNQDQQVIEAILEEYQLAVNRHKINEKDVLASPLVVSREKIVRKVWGKENHRTLHSFSSIKGLIDEGLQKLEDDGFNSRRIRIYREVERKRGEKDNYFISLESSPIKGKDDSLSSIIGISPSEAEEKNQTTRIESPPDIIYDSDSKPELEELKICKEKPTSQPLKIPCNIPFPSKLAFTGRDADMAELHKALVVHNDKISINQVRGVAITGERGMGKTQLAIEYAWKYADQYPGGVLWVDTGSGIVNEYILLADVIGLYLPQDSPEKRNVQIIKQHLQERDQTLLILDNAGSYEQVRNYLPVKGSCRILITTQRNKFGSFPSVSLEILDAEKSKELLLKESGRNNLSQDEQEAAQNVCLALGYFPLALEMAGEYLCQVTEITFGDYLTDLVNKGAIGHNSLEHFIGENTPNNHIASVKATLAATDAVLNKRPLAKPLLQAAAVVYPEGISARLLAETAGLDWENQKVQISEALALLVEFSILRQDKDKRYYIHRLRQEVIKTDLDKKLLAEMEERFARYLENWLRQEYKGKLDKLKLVATELPQLLYAARIALAHELWPTGFSLTFYLGRYYNATADYRNALDWYDKCEQFLEKKAPQDEAKKANLLVALSAVWRDKWENDKDIVSNSNAIKLCLQAIKINCDIYGTNHPNVAICLNDMGIIWRAKGQYNKAIKCYAYSVAICKKIYGKNHPLIANCLNNLGEVWRDKGQHDKAIKCYKQALAILQKTHKEGQEHPYIAICLNNLGEAWRDKGQYDEARKYITMAYKILTETLGKNHPDTRTAKTTLDSIPIESEKKDA